MLALFSKLFRGDRAAVRAKGYLEKPKIPDRVYSGSLARKTIASGKVKISIYRELVSGQAFLDIPMVYHPIGYVHKIPLPETIAIFIEAGEPIGDALSANGGAVASQRQSERSAKE